MLIIVPGEAHVWTVELDGIADPEPTVLSAAELERMGRLHFARDRRLYLASHTMLRHALSASSPDIGPAAWSFEADRNGRPELVGRPHGLRFNLSHTQGMAGCVVVRDLDCGIDVERNNRRDVVDLSRYVLAPIELDTVIATAPDHQAALFLRYWTLKEAYTKARGLGLALPLKSCVFDLAGAEPRLIEHPGEEDPLDWRFWQWWPTPHHVVAVAVRDDRRTVRLVAHTDGADLLGDRSVVEQLPVALGAPATRA